MAKARNPFRGNPPTSDPTLRLLAAASGAGRISIGLGLAFAPRLALRVLGFSDASQSTIAVARIGGGRDIAMGVETILARNDPERLTRASGASAAVDAGDALAFAAALASGAPEARRGSLRGLALAAPAAIGGALVTARLCNPDRSWS